MKKLLVIIFLFLLNSKAELIAQAPSWEWAKNAVGSTTYPHLGYTKSIDVDSAGNIYVTGYFTNPTITFDTITLIHNGTNGYTDYFIVKYDPNGHVLWAKSASSNYNDMGNSLSVDSLGNCYVVGEFAPGTITFGSIVLTNTNSSLRSDIFIVKYDNLGNVVWAKRASGPAYDYSFDSKIDDNGNFYFLGAYSNSLIIDTTNLSSLQANCRVLIKFDGLGNVIWAKNVDGNVNAYKLDVDNNGDIYIGGNFFSSATFGTTVLTNILGGQSAFIAKYDGNANFIWAKSVCASSNGGTEAMIKGVATDNFGNVFVAGNIGEPTYYINGMLYSNTGANINTLYTDIFLVKYNSVGNVLWARNITGLTIDQINSICTDSYGDLYLTGGFLSSSLDFSSYILGNNGDYDMFYAKYDPNGAVKWLLSAGTYGDDAGTDIKCTSDGSIVTTGNFIANTIVFGGTTLNSNSAYDWDLYVAKLGYSLGVENGQVLLERVYAYPNPASNLINLKVPRQLIGQHYELVDFTGKVISQGFFNNDITTLYLSTLSSGIYLVRYGDLMGESIRILKE